ncbi:MAG: DUF427 domain-containing protein [Flavobacteriales bacterium]|nr:DUF427 domain-containing protein [Flavobacteriales bacterium]
MKAILNDKVIAESNQTINIEGNQYFPAEAVNKEYLSDSQTNTVCHWKGTASYYSLEVDGKINQDAAWYYPNPSNMAKNIKGYIAFWRGVKVIN